MKLAITSLVLALLVIGSAQAGISNFKHIVVIFQENRTPDNLFQGLCVPPFGTATSCSTTPSSSQYDILTRNWLDKTSSTGKTQPMPVSLGNSYDLSHAHNAFVSECDRNTSGACKMDGAALVSCSGSCLPKPQFRFVDNSKGIVDPYLTLATQYGWANYMFQTNQGPSFPAHQFIFGGTSAPSATDDAAGVFAAENMSGTSGPAGCIALAGTYVLLIDTMGETQKIYPCFEHQTMSDLLDKAGISWKYYTPGSGSIWTAPDAINHICKPNAPRGGQCVGPEWVKDVDLMPADVLTDISNCKLPETSWVIPTGQNSDHPGNAKTVGGPSWVASIVNAIGNNKKCPNGETYWQNTAIFITWDDWGGWYDHEPPTILAAPEGDYQYGFRVPLVVVSAYTPAHLVNNARHDFGSILRFVEHNFKITEGALNFADARSSTDLTGFFNLSLTPRPFKTVTAPLDANYFVQQTDLEAPDND